MSKSPRSDDRQSTADHRPTPKPWREWAQTIGLSLFMAFGVRAAVAQSFFIPSGSMEPTLHIDDRLTVDKLSYHFQDPQRGDIVVFNPPQTAIAACGLPPGAEQTYFIKRVVGLPGDQVATQNGETYINGKSLVEPYRAAAPRDNWGPVTVPIGTYLVLGDNRNNSCDGHIWGVLPREQIVGRALVRFWPPDRMGGLGFNSAAK
jgi:signal peptidase I